MKSLKNDITEYINYWIRVITKLPNSEQSYKGKVQTHNYINRQNQKHFTFNKKTFIFFTSFTIFSIFEIWIHNHVQLPQNIYWFKWCALHSVYIFMKFVQKMYSLFVWYIFKTAAIRKKSLWFQSIPLSKYPYNLG
jgi:hypothetical protein